MSIGSRRQRLDDVGRDALRHAAPDIVTEFRGEHNRKLSTRTDMRWGSKGSFSLVIAGSKAGCWFDHELGRGGDIIEFIRLEHGCSFVDALHFAGRFVSELRRNVGRPRVVARRDNDDDNEKGIEQALGIWSETIPLRGTLAETYLRARGIEVPDEALEALRFHPACPWKRTRSPALVALVCDIITSEPIGIHRTALSAAGGKIERIALGLKGGGAIKLSPSTTELTIGEGIETTLAAVILGFGPAWSVIDAGEMGKFPVLPHIKRLTIIVDNDVSGTGQKAAAETRARWVTAGLRVRTVMPATAGHDANNVLVELLGRP